MKVEATKTGIREYCATQLKDAFIVCNKREEESEALETTKKRDWALCRTYTLITSKTPRPDGSNRHDDFEILKMES